MKQKLKMLPVIFMLVAGAVTSIITYSLKYEGKTALFVLLAVLLLFYILGLLFRNMIWRFEDEVNQKEKESLEEGKVLEKSADAAAENDSENGVKGTGEH